MPGRLKSKLGRSVLRRSTPRRPVARQLIIAGSVAAVMALAGVATIFISHAASDLNGHSIVTDSGGKLMSWYSPQSDAYDHVVALDWDYLFNKVPDDPNTGKPAYFSQSYLNTDAQTMADWPTNPAGMNAMFIESAIDYYEYSGNTAVLTFARSLADNHLANGMTSTSDDWSHVPYASGDPGTTSYGGANHGNSDGAGDGVGYIQPDKIGEFGFNLLKLYEQTGNTAYRDAAIHGADVLASHVRTGSASQSPWPYRVRASDGSVREQYTADVINPISLFDELIRLHLGNTTTYQTARTTAWNWLMQYPMQNNVWTQYFEDVRVFGDYQQNINQYIPMMTARYLLQHPEYDANWQAHVRGLIAWVEDNFVAVSSGANTIKEQEDFAFPMGSHTSRYASVNALLYDKTGDAAAKEKAYRSFNWATYMSKGNGITIDGPDVYNMWFTDGYGDYMRHFMTGMGAVPEWAPPSQNHLLRSSSVVTTVSYSSSAISYKTFDNSSTEVLHVTQTPVTVLAGGVALTKRSDLSQPGWTYSNGTLRLYHTTSGVIQINFTAGGGGKTGDLNGDGKVTIQDLALLLVAFGKTTNTAADLNHDGKVTIQDLALLLVNFGK